MTMSRVLGFLCASLILFPGVGYAQWKPSIRDRVVLRVGSLDAAEVQDSMTMKEETALKISLRSSSFETVTVDRYYFAVGIAGEAFSPWLKGDLKGFLETKVPLFDGRDNPAGDVTVPILSLSRIGSGFETKFKVDLSGELSRDGDSFVLKNSDNQRIYIHTGDIFCGRKRGTSDYESSVSAGELPPCRMGEDFGQSEISRTFTTVSGYADYFISFGGASPLVTGPAGFVPGVFGIMVPAGSKYGSYQGNIRIDLGSVA